MSKIAKITCKIKRLKDSLGLCERISLSEAECKKYQQMVANDEGLPQDIVQTDYNKFHRISNEIELSDEEKNEYYNLIEIDRLTEIEKSIQTIKKCVIFFTVLAVIGLVGGFIISLIH